MKERLIKSVNRLIWGRIVEIIIVVALVCITIPCWKSFESRVSEAKIMTLDDYNMVFSINSNNVIDNLIAENPYYISKNYKVYLEVDKNVNAKDTIIYINNKEYVLDDFYSEEDSSNKRFIIVDSDLSAGVETYNVKLKMSGNNAEYRYLFQENNIF